jgi:uncharacterized protein
MKAQKKSSLPTSKKQLPPKPAAPCILVKKSKIHGRGVFAARDIARDETIIDWNGCTEMLAARQVEALPPDERKYVSFIDGQHILFQPPARCVNHSCDANARGAKGRDMAIRAIKQGEEITVSYVVEQVPGLRLQCNCRSPACLGLLTV